MLLISNLSPVPFNYSAKTESFLDDYEAKAGNFPVLMPVSSILCLILIMIGSTVKSPFDNGMFLGVTSNFKS